MFNFFKNKKSEKENLVKSNFITFSDLISQNITIRTKNNGNETILSIANDKNKFEILLDTEKCIVLASILNTFATDKNINKILEILSESEE